jgi:hypothetical protein
MRKLDSPLQYEVTCQKLSELQQLRDEAQRRESDKPHIKRLTLLSLNRLIKQLQEEKILYECHARVREPSGQAVPSLPNTGETSTPCTN